MAIFLQQSSRDKTIYKDQDEKYIIYNQNYKLQPGAKVGEFRLGSTIVLVRLFFLFFV